MSHHHAGHRVDPGSFLDVDTLTRWQQDLDARGLRDTGSAAHHGYVADLERRMAAVGISGVQREEVPLRRWRARRWSLAVAGAEVETLSCVAYSGATPPGGTTGRLSATPAAGVIGLVDVPVLSVGAGEFDALDWAPGGPPHPAGYDPTRRFERTWLSQDPMRDALDRFAAAGAAGLVLVVDQPGHVLRAPYLLYDGVHRGIPALFVSRAAGIRLHRALDAGLDARLVLEAEVDEVATPNLVGLIPGRSDELVVLHSHTDGTNGIEDNGPEAILAMAHYLTRLPSHELPRSVLVLLSTGHFASSQAWGVEAFLAAHRDDLGPRIAAAVTLEHLGARATGSGDAGHEFGCAFTSPHPALIDATRRTLLRAAVTEARVVRPYLPGPGGHAPDPMTWPADGAPFWHTAGLPATNLITGPGYLFDAAPVMDHIDVDALRRQAIAFTELTLELAAMPWGVVRRRLVPGPAPVTSA